MKIYTKILGNIADEPWHERALMADIEHIVLDQWTAQKSRFVAHSQSGEEYAVALRRNTRLRDGDILDYDADCGRMTVIKLALRDVLEIDLEALTRASTDEIIRSAVYLGHALGNQHWPAVVKHRKVFVPLTVDRKVMESVMKSHRIEGISYSFQPASHIIPYLSPHEMRSLLGGSSPTDSATQHQHHHTTPR